MFDNCENVNDVLCELASIVYLATSNQKSMLWTPTIIAAEKRIAELAEPSDEGQTLEEATKMLHEYGLS